MATTYKLIDKTILTTAQSSLTFSTIPNTYTDLKFVASIRSSTTASDYTDVGIQFNGTTSGYSYKTIYGNGSSAGSFGGSSQDKIYDIWANTGLNTSNTFTSVDIYIPNYTSGNQKSLSMDAVAENNASNGYQTMSAGLSNITAAITSISIIPAAGSWIAGSSFYLYGIKNS
jgi:hypothetical protein